MITARPTSDVHAEPATRSALPVIGLCSGALFVPLIGPLLVGRVFTKDDLGALHVPFRYLYQSALRAGDSFLWTSAYRSGLYLHGEGEGGMAHPLHLGLYRFLPLGVAFNLEILATYVAMFVGGGVLLRRLGLPREAAWFGAMVFTFSGFNLFNLMHVNHIATVAHIPWLLVGVTILFTSKTGRERALAFAGIALAFGSQLLIGNPQYLWMTALAVACATGCLVWTGAPAGRISLLGAALAAGALIGAVQLLPTLDFARESTRVAWSADQALSFSLSPANLIQLWSPFAFQFRIYAPAAEAQIVHEFIVYNGAFCTIALAWVIARWRQQTRKGLILALLLVAGVALVLAFGRYGGVYSQLAGLPGFRTLRAPARHLVLFDMALSGLAAIVFEDLLTIARRGGSAGAALRPVVATAAFAATITVGAAVLARTSIFAAVGNPPVFSSLLRSGPWAALVMVVAAMVALTARGVRWALPATIALVAFDQGLWGYSYVYRWGPIRDIATLKAEAPVPPGASRGDLIAPLIEGSLDNVAVLRDVRLLTGYTGLTPASVLDPSDTVTQRLAGVAWRETSHGWQALPDAMPRVRLVSIDQVSRNMRSDLETADVSQVALTDEPTPSLSGTPGQVRVVSDRPGSIAIETEAPGRQLLVVTERFHAGWTVAIDEREGQTWRVYGDFLGCVVEPGRHRVAFAFSPASARQGLNLTLAGVALTIVGTAVMWRAA